MAQGMPCRVLGTFEVGRSQWSIGFFFHCQLYPNQHAGFPVSRLLRKQAHLQSQIQPLQSQTRFAITIPTLQTLSYVMVVLIQSETVFRMAERFG